MPSFFDLVREQELEMAELDKRYQVDVDLLHLSKYVMRVAPDIEGIAHAIPGIVNATLNKPAIFGTNVVSALGAVKEQTIVESDDEGFDTHPVELILEAAFDGANDRLRKMRLPLLNPFADANICFRGRTGRRILFREEDGILIPDIMNWDGRYIRYKMGADGLDWTGYVTRRSKSEIDAEYGIVIDGKFAQVLDVWDKEHNEVWINEKHVIVSKNGKERKEEHNYGYTPVVIEIVPLGYGDMLLDEDRLKNEGESIFFMIRDVVPQMNMLMSILTTLNFLSVKRPAQWESKDGQQEAPDYDKALAPGAMAQAEIGGGLKTIDFGDALRAAEMADRKLEKALQEGSYTDIDIGNVSQPFSAVALITIGEGRDQLLLPRLATKEWLNVDTAEMVTLQLLQIGGTVELGGKGHKQKFSTGKLKGDYTIGYKYFIKSPKIDIARISMAGQAEKWYPREHIYEEVLQVEDPVGMKKDWDAGLAGFLDPNVQIFDTIMALLEKAEDGDENAEMKAFIMAQDMGISIEQLKAGIVTVPERPKLSQGEGAVPLLPEGGRVGGTVPSSAKKAGELTQTPREEI
ncbi:hypothetical protein LCGC14_2146770 [marine sediment metagenome]|uniref:Portal protein n=1 Tax=marine sediment metagenome TaxID=412755 RepID=A0A0F9DWQ1_9ZZZZ